MVHLQYNFDRVWHRKQTNSMKWDGLSHLFGADDLLPLWVADMDFQAPKPVIDALKRHVQHGIFGYTIRPSSYDEAIVEWFKRRHGFEIQKDWLVHSPGIVPALNIIVRTFTKPGDKIIIQPPVYYPFFNAVRRNGRTIVENPLAFDGRRYTIDFADLEQKIDADVKMLILCSPHNPVGRVWTQEELRRLGELCLQHDILVVADEIHGDLVRRSYRHTPFASLSQAFAEQSITCSAPSKTFNLAGLQTSHLIVPNAQLRETLKREFQNLALDLSNSFAVPAVEAAYRYGEEWLDQLLDYLEGNLQYLSHYFAESIPQVKVIEPEGTYLVWLDFRSLGLSTKQLKTLMQKKAKVALDEGYIFGTEGAGFERINIACPRRTLGEALRRIEGAVNSLI